MNVTSTQIIDRGVPNKERLYFKTLVGLNLSYVVVFISNYTSSTSVSSGRSRAFWFPPKTIRAGDHVLLYTGLGTPGDALHTDGNTIHWFYWGLQETIWNEPNSCALVFELNTWQATPYR